MVKIIWLSYKGPTTSLSWWPTSRSMLCWKQADLQVRNHFPPPYILVWKPGGEEDEGDDDANMMEEEVDKSLHIKGQMNFMPDWNVVMFLCSPAIANLEQLQVFSINVAGMIATDVELWLQLRLWLPLPLLFWLQWLLLPTLTKCTAGCRPLHLRSLHARLLEGPPPCLQVFAEFGSKN